MDKVPLTKNRRVLIYLLVQLHMLHHLMLLMVMVFVMIFLEMKIKRKRRKRRHINLDMRNKLMLGKDRAIGAGVETPTNAIKKIDKDANEKRQVEDLDDIEDTMNAFINPTNENISQSQASIRNALGGSKKTKKRSRTTKSSLDSLVDVMKNIGKHYEGTSQNVARIAKCFEAELEWSSKGLHVFQEISKLGGFNDSELLKAGELLSKDAARPNYFFTLPDGLKKLYIQRLLGGEM